jgi:hypothetical protein
VAGDLGGATTDARGLFVLSDLPAGPRFDVTIRRAGFAPLSRSVRGKETDGGPADLGTFVLTPGSNLDVLVTDAAGTPIGGAEVWSGAWTVQGFRADPTPQATGADGRFTLRDLPLFSSVIICHPRYLFRTIELSAGTPPSRLVLSPGARISGRVVDPDGRPLPGSEVTAQSTDSAPTDVFTTGYPCGPPTNFAASTSTDEEGSFTLEPLEEGWFHLQARAAGYRPAASGRLHTEPGLPLLTVEIVLQPEAAGPAEPPPAPPELHEIHGTVLDPDGAPAASARVEEAVTAADGSFVLRRPEGQFRVRAVKEGFAPAETGVEVQGREVAGVQIWLSRGAVLSGRVLGLTPEDSRDAVILALGPVGQELAVAVEDDGSYRLEHLAPGPWSLQVDQTSIQGRISLAAEEDAVLDLVAPSDPAP